MNAEIQSLLHFRRDFRQHGEAAAEVKATHDDGYAQRPEFPAEIERARKLIGLHADQADHAAASFANAPGDGAHIHEIVALIAGFDLDLDIGTEHVRLRAMLHQRIDAGETVGRNVRAPPLNDITVGVPMPKAWLYQAWPGPSSFVPPLSSERPVRSLLAALLRGQIKHAGFKALHAARKAYDLQEKFASRLSEVDRERWGERRKLVEAELKRIAGLGTS